MDAIDARQHGRDDGMAGFVVGHALAFLMHSARQLGACIKPVIVCVSLDGKRWVSSDTRHFLVQIVAGTHRV